MFAFRLKTMRALLLVGALTAFIMASVQSRAQSEKTGIDITSLYSNTPSSDIDRAISAENRKLDLGDAYKIGKPGSFRQVEPFAPPPSSQGRYSQPMINNRKVMELMHRQKEWVFLEPNEAEFGLSAEDIFNLRERDSGEDGEEELSPLARFYHRINERDRMRTNDVSSTSEEQREIEAFNFDNLWSASQGIANAQFLQPSSIEPSVRRDSFVMGSGGLHVEKPDVRADEERLRLKETRAEQFKRMLDSNFAITGSDAPTPVAGGGSWYHSSDPWNFPSSRPAQNGLQPVSPPASIGSAFSPLPSVAGLPTGLPGVQDVSTAGGFPSLTPASPTVQDNRFDMPQPVFTMPKRKM